MLGLRCSNQLLPPLLTSIHSQWDSIFTTMFCGDQDASNGSRSCIRRNSALNQYDSNSFHQITWRTRTITCNSFESRILELAQVRPILELAQVRPFQDHFNCGSLSRSNHGGFNCCCSKLVEAKMVVKAVVRTVDDHVLSASCVEWNEIWLLSASICLMCTSTD